MISLSLLVLLNEANTPLLAKRDSLFSKDKNGCSTLHLILICFLSFCWFLLLKEIDAAAAR